MPELMPNKMVKAGEVIFAEGDFPEEGMYYICYGDVEISRKEISGERSLAKLTTGGVFGEMALINNEPRNATVKALSDCGFFVVKKETFQHQVQQLDPLMRGVFRVFVLTIRDFIDQRKDWLDQLYNLTQQMGVSAQNAEPKGDGAGGGGLASGEARKMNY